MYADENVKLCKNSKYTENNHMCQPCYSSSNSDFPTTYEETIVT